MGKLISISGNIGSGKTFLSEALSENMKWDLESDDITENPYIDDFYEDMYRWSLNMQIYYLHARFNKIIENKKSKRNVIQDRAVYEDSHVFAPVLHSMQVMSDRDYHTYQELFGLINSFVSPPELLIYLRSSVDNLLNRIRQRNRPFETSISSDYLQRLNERYEAWIQNYPYNHLIIDVDDTDLNDPDQIRQIVGKVNDNINSGI